MANLRRKNYDELLSNVRARRTAYDERGFVSEAVLTKSFSDTSLPKSVKYIHESMEEVGPEYTAKTYAEAERVQNQITKAVAASDGVIRTVNFEHQGSVPTGTHIKVHSDLDILVLHGVFHYGTSEYVPRQIYQGNALDDMKELRTNVYNRLKTTYWQANVSNEKDKAVQIEGGSLKRKFDIIFCSWHNTPEYYSSRKMHERGISLYDKGKHSSLEDYPFSNIYRVGLKDDSPIVNGNLRRAIRLLKSVKMDATPAVGLNSFIITSTLYNMPDSDLYALSDHLSTLPVNISLYLDKVIDDENYRLSLKSPNGTENVYQRGDAATLRELKRLKLELDEVIADAAADFQEMYSDLRGTTISKGYSDTGSVFLNESHSTNMSDAYATLKRSTLVYR